MSAFEFSWLSFGFAVINFLVLAGLLWKFLHKPLLNTLEKRRSDIEATKQAAQEETEKARQAKDEYEKKLVGADQERDKLIAETRQSAENAKKTLLEKASASAERNVANLQRAYEGEQREALATMQEKVVETALGMAGAILRKVTDSDVDSRLRDSLSSKLDELAASGETSDLHSSGDGAPPVRVVSARELPRDESETLRKRIGEIVGKDVEVEFLTDSELVAGTTIEFSSMAIDSSLADTLDVVREQLAVSEKPATTGEKK
jgi:F-type H+-transporting ATPase subunit b